jgi:hypothetical protein
MQYGKPVIGVDIAACASAPRRGHTGGAVPRAGGYSTVAWRRPSLSLPELATWFRTKPAAPTRRRASSRAWEEGTLYADVDIAAVRRFPGYFYRAANP